MARSWMLPAMMVLLSGAHAHAQDAAAPEEEVVPPPPGAPATEPVPEPVTEPGAGSTLFGPAASQPGPTQSPPRPSADGAMLAPLLTAAEGDLAAGRNGLALSRASVVSNALPENVPLRIRADGLRLLARQRLAADAPAPPLDEVLAPLVAQAEMDLRASRVDDALPRLQLALDRLPATSALRDRAEALRQLALQATGPDAPVSSHGGGTSVPPPPLAPPLAAPERRGRPADPDRRGTAEAVELYITASMLGALTGAYIPFVASDNTASGLTYTLSIIGGAGLFAVGVLTLDLSGALRTGIPPTIASSIRFGFVTGALAWGIAVDQGLDDPSLHFTLAWGGAALGAVVGVGVGFGAQPRVPEQRLVESIGIWGGGLMTSIALLTDYEDPTLGMGLSIGGLNAGLMAGIMAVAAGARLPIRRTLFLDLGFVGGYGLGMGLTLLGYSSSTSPVELPALGVASLVGSVGGWVLLWLLTDGMEIPEDDPLAQVRLGLAPIQGGGVVTLGGSLD